MTAKRPAPEPLYVSDETARPPTWVDKARLCRETCISDRTVDAWVHQGLLPPPRLRGGKLMWRWSEVDQYLDRGGPDVQSSVDSLEERIRRGTREAVRERGQA